MTNLIVKAFGKPFLATKVAVTFPEVGGAELCSVEVRPANTPVYLMRATEGGSPQERFYVRSGNSSQELSLSEAQNYIASRFV